MSAFTVERPLRFGDCDPSGIAYYPAYMDMLVAVTEDLFAAIGWPWPKLRSERGIATPTVRLDLTFLHPGFEGDRLTFRCAVATIGRSSLDLRHEVAAAQPLWRAEQRLVATDSESHRATPWPDDIRDSLKDYEDESHA